MLQKAPEAAAILYDIHSANAAARLGYPALFAYFDDGGMSLNPANWILPGHYIASPATKFKQFYGIDEKIRIFPLPYPWPLVKIKKWMLLRGLLAKRYFFPYHVFPRAGLFWIREDWQLAKEAISNGVATIYVYDHCHDFDFEPKFARSPFLQCAVTVCDVFRNEMIAHGLPREKIITLPGVVNNKFLKRYPQEAEKWRERFIRGGKKILAIYGGALYRFKGIDMLIEVAKRLSKIQFVIAGGGDEQVWHYRETIKSKGVSNVEFIGYISQEQLPALFQAADVLLYPHLLGSHGDVGSPLKFFEYMASGGVVVATEVGHMQVFKDQKLVMEWCEPGNPDAFAGALRRTIVKYPRKTEGYVENICFAREFTWEKRMERILQFVSSRIELKR